MGEQGIDGILHGALEAAESYQQSITDAERAGDRVLAAWFRKLERDERALAARARALLAEPAEPACEASPG